MDVLEFIRVRELDIAVRIWNPTAPRTLIAWHGLARHGGDFAALAGQLGSEWRIIAPDTPGRGLSSWSLFPAHDYLYSHYMTVALAVLDHYELTHANWLGTSMGGLLGMFIAADPQHNHRIARLILNDVGPELNQQGLMALSSYFSVSHRFNNFSALLAELKQHYASFGISNEDEWRNLALDSARRLPDGGWTYHFDPRIGEQFIHDTPRDTWSDWMNITCPVMVIHGEDSTLLDADTLGKMADKQPQLKILSVPECGHAPMLNQPKQAVPIKLFLEKPLTPKGPATGGSLHTPPLHATTTGSVGKWLIKQWQRWFK